MKPHLAWRFSILLATVALLLFSACNRSLSDLSYAPVITEPLEGAFFYTGERIGIQAEIANYAGYSHMELYLDDDLIVETGHWSIDTLLEIMLPGEGAHTFKAIGCDLQGNCTESVVSFRVISHPGESNDLESFSDSQIPGWFFSGWELTSAEGYDDNQSLRSSSGLSTLITRKRFTEPGGLTFFVKEGSGVLTFLMDGKVKSRWFGKEDWGAYSFSVPTGDHIFKWIADEEYTFIDRISFTPGVTFHTPGEHFGGGTIFYLDSTGQHGLVAAMQDGNFKGNPEIPWGCYGLVLISGTRALSRTDGKGNTLAIVTDCDLENIAARYCDNLTVAEDDSTWEDWYLPAIDELNLVYKNQDKIENLVGTYYWSSTSNYPNAAAVINFTDGRHHGANRNIPNISGPSTVGIYVRPIREF